MSIIGHCIRLIMKVKDDIDDPPYVHDVVDKSYETVAVYSMFAPCMTLV